MFEPRKRSHVTKELSLLQKINDISKLQKVPDEILDVLATFKDTTQELDLHSSALSRTARVSKPYLILRSILCV